MKALWKMTWTEAKLFAREPMAAFFTVVFPLIVLFVFGSIFGNEPTPEMGGRGSVDVSVPGYIAMIIGTVGMIGLPITLASYREQGILRRLRATPLHPSVILASQVLVNLLMTAVGVAILIVAARLVYGLHLPASPIAVILGVLLGSLSFFALGFVLAGLLPTARSAQTVGMALFFPMLFLSGAALPRQMFSETLRNISEFLPLTHVTILIEDLWLGEGWSVFSLLVLAGMLLVGAIVSSRTFRWE